MIDVKDLEITNLDTYLFREGTHYDIFRKLGAHPAKKEGKRGVYFAVWVPNAIHVSVVGEFNEWDNKAHIMKQCSDKEVYHLFIPEVEAGVLYKFCIVTKEKEVLYKADPFANYCELRPGNASKTVDIDAFRWSDKAWMRGREDRDPNTDPVSIYEVHPGSFMRHPGREDDGFYNYRELAHVLADYVTDMGFTHVELMGIAEHPFDGSWGYQVTGYYAPTSRYGSPEDFQYFIDYLHKKKIGVILDWVPAHFPKDPHGLAEFDGKPLYEYANPKKGEHLEWGTKVFDYSKNEIKNFLIANALFWIEHYHLDGLRVDAVASMLYLDYGREKGEWIPNRKGGNTNLEAEEFLKHLNSVVTGRNHGVLMIAEESTAWPGVTARVGENGLGFSMKWNMGWMNDFLEYMKTDPYFRKHSHHKMTFSMEYAYSEKYILVLSHDEVVHMKGSLIDKMPGEVEEKFANLRAAYGFMIGHPGKKLLFMGQDFAQIREWSEARELDWYLLQEDRHRQMQDYVRDLMHLYKKSRGLYELDFDLEGFQWINKDDAERSIFSFIRYSKTRRNNFLFVCNFTPVERTDYMVGVPKKKKYHLVLNSDDKKYGGKGSVIEDTLQAEKGECDGYRSFISFPLPAYGVIVFKF